jgi:hypothetical protein
MALSGTSSDFRIYITWICLFLGLATALALFGAILTVIMNISLFAAVVFYLGLVFIGMIWLKPFWGLLFLLFIIPLQYLGKITEDGSLTVAKVVMPLVAMVWIARHIILRKERLIRVFFSHPIFIACELYFLSVLLSFINAKDLVSAFLFLVTKLVPYFLIAVIVVDMVQTRNRLKYLYQTVLVISFIVVGIFGLYELITNNSILNLFGMDYYLISGSSEGVLASTKTDVLSGGRESDWSRVASTYLDPDLLCAYAVLSFGFAMGLWHLTTSFLWRTMIVTYILITNVIVVATGSRAGFLGMAIFWGLSLLMFRFPFRKTLMVVLVLAVLSLIPYIEDFLPVYRRGISMEAFYSDPRYGFWTTAIKMIKDKPLIGVGLANFPSVYFDYLTPSTPRGKAFMAHNILLQVLSETGIIGFIFFTIVIAVFWGTLCRIIAKSKDLSIIKLSKCLLISTFSFIPSALTHNVLDQEHLWIIFGVTVVLYNMSLTATSSKKNTIRP